MNAAINWREAIGQLPGLFLNDQHPEGSGLAVSIEKQDAARWIVHSIQEQNGAPHVFHSHPLSAVSVYQTLHQLYESAGYTPEITEEERRILGLPHKEDLVQETLKQKLPGTWLGAPGDQADSEWDALYSVEKQVDGSYSLYTCVTTDETGLLSEPEVDKSGTYSLAGLLDELRILGFQEHDLAFMFSFTAHNWNEAAKNLPGSVLPNSQFEKNHFVLSIVQEGEDYWRLFHAEQTEYDTFSIVEIPGLDAKHVYKTVDEISGELIPPSVRKRIHLPSLDRLYFDALTKKLKGDWIGTVLGADESGKRRERYVTLFIDNEIEWSLHYAKSEDLTASGKGARKVQVYKAGPFHTDDFITAADNLDPVIDSLDLILQMRNHSNPEIVKFAQILYKQLE